MTAVIDANQTDGGVSIDAAPDAQIDASISPNSLELTGGAGHLTGPTYRMDVQVGHPYAQRAATSPALSAEGNAAVKP